MTDRPTLGLREAAEAAGVSLKTIRRRATAGTFPNAYRLDGPKGPGSGPWQVPVPDLIAAGFTLHASHPEPSAPEPPEADRLRLELNAERARREAAEREARDLRANLDDVRLALRALTAAVEERPAPVAETTPAPVTSPRGLWSRLFG